MVRRRVLRGKKSSRWSSKLQRETRHLGMSSTSTRDIDKSMGNPGSRFYDHPYATRSKTLRTAQSLMNVDVDDYASLRRRRSDSSIVFLGKYRKIPELVVIDEIEGRYTEFVEIPKNVVCLKEERNNCCYLGQNDCQRA